MASIVANQRVHEFLNVESAFLMQEELFGEHEDASNANDPHWYSYLEAHQHHFGDAQLTRHLHHEFAHLSQA